MNGLLARSQRPPNNKGYYQCLCCPPEQDKNITHFSCRTHTEIKLELTWTLPPYFFGARSAVQATEGGRTSTVFQHRQDGLPAGAVVPDCCGVTTAFPSALWPASRGWGWGRLKSRSVNLIKTPQSYYFYFAKWMTSMFLNFLLNTYVSSPQISDVLAQVGSNIKTDSWSNAERINDIWLLYPKWGICINHSALRGHPGRGAERL